MAQHHGVAESERQVDETVGGGVMEWTHGQVTLGILERRLTAPPSVSVVVASPA